MKYYMVLYLLSFTCTEEFNIDVKYKPKFEIRRRRSFHESLVKNRHSKQYKINEQENTDVFINKKGPINVPLELDERFNRLPEVNLKYLITSAEIVNNDSVEDFIDLFSEENNDADTDSQKATSTQNSNNAKEFIDRNYNEVRKDEPVITTKNKRVVRHAATASYDGRYKFQDINDVLNSIAENTPQSGNMKKPGEAKVAETNNGLGQTRLKRSSNIIEEENLATTISVFKFTGRVSLLNQDLAYKNIHT